MMVSLNVFPLLEVEPVESEITSLLYFDGEYEYYQDKFRGVVLNRYKIKPDFCNLSYCEICGKAGNPRYTRERSDVFGWDSKFEVHQMGFAGHKDSVSFGNILCTGCWNKARSINQKKREANKIRKAINQLKQEYRKCQKSQKQAS